MSDGSQQIVGEIAPDAGALLINVNTELVGWSAERAKVKAGEIYDTLIRLFDLAKAEGIPTYRAADRLAERRIEAVAKLKRTWV